MNTILISIHPKHCPEIFETKRKTLEIRKFIPKKIKTPFCCCVYETKKHGGKGKVIGEFICDKTTEIDGRAAKIDKDLANNSCCSFIELFDYNYRAKNLYTLHITEPKLYDEPKYLFEFLNLDGEQISQPPQSWRYIRKGIKYYTVFEHAAMTSWGSNITVVKKHALEMQDNKTGKFLSIRKIVEGA